MEGYGVVFLALRAKNTTLSPLKPGVNRAILVIGQSTIAQAAETSAIIYGGGTSQRQAFHQHPAGFPGRDVAIFLNKGEVKYGSNHNFTTDWQHGG
jgi:hypothetical protein